MASFRKQKMIWLSIILLRQSRSGPEPACPRGLTQTAGNSSLRDEVVVCRMKRHPLEEESDPSQACCWAGRSVHLGGANLVGNTANCLAGSGAHLQLAPATPSGQSCPQQDPELLVCQLHLRGVVT